MDSSGDKENTPTQFVSGYTLVVGVGADLPATVNDAGLVADLLGDPERCAYPSQQVHLLTEEEANRSAILAKLDLLAATVDAESTVVLYFSGHGYQVQTPTGSAYYLMPFGYDTQRLADSAISGAEFTAKLRAIPARRLLVLLDCCHAGGLPGAKSPGLTFAPKAIPDESLALLAEGGGKVFIASSRADELSWAGKPYSAFTLALAEALSGSGVAQRDGLVRVSDLALYASQVVPMRTGDSQHPVLHFEHADNFPVAYYAGGESQAKGLPFAAPPPDADVRTEEDRRTFELYTRVVLALEKRRYRQALSLLDRLEEAAPYYPRIDELRESAKRGIRRRLTGYLLAGFVGLGLLVVFLWPSTPDPIVCEGDQRMASEGRVSALHSFRTKDGRDGLWIGRIRGGLELWIDGTRADYFYADDLGSISILSLAVNQSDGSLWLGTFRGGLTHLSPSNDLEWQVDKRVTAQEHQLAGCNGSALLVTKKGVVYAGFEDTREGVLAFSTTGERWDSTPLAERGEHKSQLFQVRNLVEDSSGMLWVGTSTGLFSFDGKGWFSYTPSSEGEALNVRSLFVDNLDRLWIGTDSAELYLFQPTATNERWRRVQIPPRTGVIYSFAQTPENSEAIYAGGETGLMACSPSACDTVAPFADSPIFSLEFASDNTGLWLGVENSVLRYPLP